MRLTRGVVSNTPRGGRAAQNPLRTRTHDTHTRGCLDARKLKPKLGVCQPAGRRNKNVYNHRRESRVVVIAQALRARPSR